MNSLSRTDLAQATDGTVRHRRLTRLAGFASWASFVSAALMALATAYLWLVEGALSDWLAKSVEGIMVTPSSTMIGAAALAATGTVAETALSLRSVPFSVDFSTWVADSARR